MVEAAGVGPQTPGAIEREAKRRTREASLLDEFIGL